MASKTNVTRKSATRAVVVEPSALDTLPAAPATLGRMSLAYAKAIVAEYTDGDDKLARRVALCIPLAGHTSEQIAERVFALYKRAGVRVPGGFGSSTMDLSLGVARRWREHAISERVTLGADLVPVLASSVRIAREPKAAGGGLDVLADTWARACKGARTTGVIVGRMGNAEATVSDAASARRKGMRATNISTDTADGRAAIASHDERAADARVGEKKTRKARVKGTGASLASGASGTVGGAPVTPRTPESGPDPLTPATPGNQTDAMPGAGTSKDSGKAPAQAATLASASVAATIRHLRALIADPSVTITPADDTAFTALAEAWEERVTERPVTFRQVRDAITVG